MKERNMLTAEQAELCHFLLSKTYTLMQKDTFLAREIVLEKRLFMFRPGCGPGPPPPYRTGYCTNHSG